MNIEKIEYNIWSKCMLQKDIYLKSAIKALNISTLKIIFVMRKDKLIGTLTDGDIRRALLKGITLDDSIDKIFNKNYYFIRDNNISKKTLSDAYLKGFSVIPIVNKDKKIIEVVTSQTQIKVEKKENYIILMVGGKGERLRPYTNNCPKCMLEVNGKPILEHIIDRFKEHGFYKFYFSVNYLKNNIKDYFKDGKKFNIDIKYIEEKSPLGTAGSLAYLSNKIKSNLPIIVANGDIITGIDFTDLIKCHNKTSAFATIAIRRFEIHNPYGVILSDKNKFLDIEEKPTYSSMINAGVYILDSTIFKYTKKIFLDMPDLLVKLKNLSKNICVYPVHEDWIEIGKPIDLENANKMKIN